MTKFLSGIDIASHQETMDLAKMPIDFVVIKSTGGVSYINPSCDKHFQQALKLGLKIGFYHYACEYDKKNDPITEAKWFIKNTKNYFGKAIPVLDFESVACLNDPSWAKTFLDYVYNETGVKPLFYSYTYIVNKYDFSSIFKADYGLWIANYGYNGLEYSFRKPYPPISNGNPVIVMYQYSSNTILSGYPNPIDVNVFYGDRTIWDRYVKSEKPINQVDPDYHETEKDKNESGGIKMKTLIVKENRVRLRSKPNPTDKSNILMEMSKGDLIEINDLIETNGYLWGIQPRNNGSKGYIAMKYCTVK